MMYCTILRSNIRHNTIDRTTITKYHNKSMTNSVIIYLTISNIPRITFFIEKYSTVYLPFIFNVTDAIRGGDDVGIPPSSKKCQPNPVIFRNFHRIYRIEVEVEVEVEDKGRERKRQQLCV